MARAVEPATLPIPSWLRHRVKVWLRRAGLETQWDIAVQFKAKVIEGRVACAAITRVIPGYNTATITFSKVEYDSMSGEEVDRLICHELHHLVMARVNDTIDDMVGMGHVAKVVNRELERVADQFAITLTRAYKRKKD